MKRKNFISLLGILVLFIIVALIYNMVEKSPEVSKPLANKEFNRIEIKTDDTLIVFEKRVNKWTMVSPVAYGVDESNFNRLLEGIKNLEIGEIISSNPEKYRIFGVDDKGIEIRIITKRDTVSFILGKMGANYQYYYLKFPSKDAVYLSKGLTSYTVNKKVDDWRDKTIFSFDKAKIKGIIIGDKKIARRDTVWLVNNEEIEAKKMDPILSTLCNLKADGFTDTVFTEKTTITISLIDNTEEILYISEKTDSKYYVMREGNPTIFKVNKWKIDKLIKI